MHLNRMDQCNREARVYLTGWQASMEIVGMSRILDDGKWHSFDIICYCQRGINGISHPDIHVMLALLSIQSVYTTDGANRSGLVNGDALHFRYIAPTWTFSIES
jgi:hypothetical protein